jgi:hypothetical protein
VDELKALRHVRGECPPADALVEYQALAPSDQAAHAIHDHVQICSRCQLVLLHLDEPETAASTPSSFTWRQAWALPLAAALVLAVLGPYIYQRFTPATDRPAEPETVRGTELQPVAPVGAVSELREFRWQSPITTPTYALRVYRGNTEIWSATSSTTTFSSALPSLLPDVEYTWQVDAIDREGVVRMQSPRQAFVVRP